MKRKNAVKRDYLLKCLHLCFLLEIAHSNPTDLKDKEKQYFSFTNLSGNMKPTKTETFLLVVPVNVSSALVQQDLF